MASLKTSIQQLLSQKNDVIADLSKRVETLRRRRSELIQQIDELRLCNVSVQDFIDIACHFIDEGNKSFVSRLKGSSSAWHPDSEGNGRILSNPSFKSATETPLRIKTILNTAFSQDQNITAINPAVMYLFADDLKKGVARMMTELCSHYPNSFNESNRPIADIQADIVALEAQVADIDAELAEITGQAAQLGEAI